jgi:tRNA(Met) cytidine acetyltransferase
MSYPPEGVLNVGSFLCFYNGWTRSQCMEYAARLLADARRANERRALVLAGSHSGCRDLARDLFDSTGVDPAASVGVGTQGLPCETVAHEQTSRLMGTTQQLLIYDCHERCEPTGLGQTVGAVDGGGLFVLLTPPFDEWPEHDDEFGASLAVPPFERAAVGSAFRRRLVETVRSHRGVALVDADTGSVEKDGRTDPPPRRPRDTHPLRRDSVTTDSPRTPVSRSETAEVVSNRVPQSRPSGQAPPSETAFPRAAYEACLTTDQCEALAAFESLEKPDQALVVEADRGRGKSSVAGLGAACLAHDGRDVLVTALGYRNTAALFERASELLDRLGTLDATEGDPPERIETADGQLRFRKPAAAAELPGDPDHVVVDEAAAIPVHLLDSLLATDSLAFVTTIHGYEGAGRGFSVRFRDHLAGSDHTVTECQLTEPIRYGPADPVEVWSFHALGLDARPVHDRVLLDATTPVTPGDVTYRELSTAALLADEHLLREVFGLLVEAHYRTEPNDFARLLDAPNVSVHALLAEGHVVSVALLAREGGLSESWRTRLFEGERIRGNLIPDLLTSQLRDPGAGRAVGERVVRIATHSAVRSRGLGSHLLDELEADAREQERDWLGVGYGATPQLVDFWRANGYRAVHLGVTRNDRSGEHSAIMLRPLSTRGEALTDRHTEWFARRFPDTLVNALSALDADVVRAVCRAIDRPPSLSLSEWERRMVEGIPDGTAIYDTAPRPVTMLGFRYLTAGDGRLTDRQERLLVRKTLQAADWDTVADELDYVSSSACMRALGETVATLLDWEETATVGPEEKP